MILLKLLVNHSSNIFFWNTTHFKMKRLKRPFSNLLRLESVYIYLTKMISQIPAPPCHWIMYRLILFVTLQMFCVSCPKFSLIFVNKLFLCPYFIFGTLFMMKKQEVYHWSSALIALIKSYLFTFIRGRKSNCQAKI